MPCILGILYHEGLPKSRQLIDRGIVAGSSEGVDHIVDLGKQIGVFLCAGIQSLKLIQNHNPPSFFHTSIAPSTITRSELLLPHQACGPDILLLPAKVLWTCFLVSL